LTVAAVAMKRVFSRWHGSETLRRDPSRDSVQRTRAGPCSRDPDARGRFASGAESELGWVKEEPNYRRWMGTFRIEVIGFTTTCFGTTVRPTADDVMFVVIK
jgi:hypothetical protein